MTAYLVRHAKAGDREEWDQPDHLRPLTKSGRKQAEGLVAALADSPIDRIVTSPYVRCVQTVEPLAQARRLPIERSTSLAEGAGGATALGLARGHPVLCTHGDVILDVLERLAEKGLVAPEETRLKKGSIWVIETNDGQAITGARYLPPPG